MRKVKAREVGVREVEVREVVAMLQSNASPLLHSSFKYQQLSYSFKLLPANFKQAVTASLSGTTDEII